MSVKIAMTNRTGYDTHDLLMVLHAAYNAAGCSAKKVVRVKTFGGDKIQRNSSTHCTELGCEGTWMTLFLPQDPAKFRIADLARVVFKVGLLDQGQPSRRMTIEQREPYGRSIPPWVTIRYVDARVQQKRFEKLQLKSRKRVMSKTSLSDSEKVEHRRVRQSERTAQREKDMRARLLLWLSEKSRREKSVLAAEKKIKFYQKKVAYYDRRAEQKVAPKDDEQMNAVKGALKRGTEAFG